MRRVAVFGVVVAVFAAIFAIPAGAASTVPGRPRIVSVTTFDGGATITWAPPVSTGGAALTGYHVTELGGVVVTDAGSAARSVRVPLEENGATYDIAIAARNSVGLGSAAKISVVPRPNGYWMLGRDGSVYAFGQVKVGPMHAVSGATYVHIEPSRSGQQIWIVTERGEVDAFPTLPFALGSDAAKSFGNLKPGVLLPGERVVSLSRVSETQAPCNCTTPIYESYWIFTSRGRVLPFGAKAKWFGDLTHIALSRPIVGSVPTPTGKGYYMVAADGGVFAFGDAKFHGSTGNRHLNAPVMALVPTTDNAGYWLVASDGGVFAFHAPFRGSMGGTPLNRPINGMVRFGNGYLMVASDGGVFDFSNKKFYGSLAGRSLPAPIVSIAASG